MNAFVQAMLTQVVALFLIPAFLPMGLGSRVQNGIWASCLLFWFTFVCLHFWHRGHVTRFDLFFLRWDSVTYILLGTPILMLLLEFTWEYILGFEG